jgi:hypothetical protein
MYTSKATMAAAIAYYTAELGSRGWLARPDLKMSQDMPQFADRVYGKEGHVVQISVGGSGDDSQMINATYYGNIDLLAAPRPEGAEAFGKPNPIHVSYLLPTDVAATAALCRRVLALGGWHQFQSFNEGPPLSKTSESMKFMKNAVYFSVLITKGPEQFGGKTLLDYSAGALVPFDMPIAPDADGLKIDSQKREVEYQTARDAAGIAQFYKTAGASLGWVFKPGGNDNPRLLLFDHSVNSRVVIEATPLEKGGTRVEGGVIARERPQIAQTNPAAPTQPAQVPTARESERSAQEKAADELAQNVERKGKEILETSDPSKILESAKELEKLVEKSPFSKGKKARAGALSPQDRKAPKVQEVEKPDAAVAVAPADDVVDAEKVALPASAEGVVIDPAAKSIQYVSNQAVDDQREFFRSSFDKLGWHSSSTSTSIINGQKTVNMTLYKGEGEVSFEMAADRPPGKNTTTITGKGLRFTTRAVKGDVAAARPAVKAEGLAAKDVKGLPIPDECENQMDEASPYRRLLATSAAGDLPAIIAFYDKELGARGWTPAKGKKVEKERAELPFLSAAGEELTATLTQAGKEVQIELLLRRPLLVAKSGLLAAPDKARLVIGNQFAGEAVVSINGQPYPIAQGAGAKDPSDALKVQLFPGTNQLVIKIPGKADVSQELPVSAGEIWGLMIFENGNALPVQIY